MTQDASQHFQETLGNVPPPIEVLVAHAPEVLDAYTEFRRYVLTDRDAGLDLKTKELLFVVLDVVHDNEAGAMNHLHAALAAGLTPTELLEALLQLWMVGGIQTWGKSGHRVFMAALEATNDQEN